MIVTAVMYVFYSHYFHIYDTIGAKYDLTRSSLIIQTTFEVFFFILLLIGLDRRVKRKRRDFYLK